MEEKFIKTDRKFKFINHPYVELYCEDCGTIVGKFVKWDVDLTAHMYCDKCASKYARKTPYTLHNIKLNNGSVVNMEVISDIGTKIIERHSPNPQMSLEVEKLVYFHPIKGRYIKIKNKKYFLD